MKKIKTIHELSNDGKNLLDVTVYIQRGNLIKFALNYRTQIRNNWYEVYRADNFHGYFHEQKLWISDKPVRKEDEEKTHSLKDLFDIYLNLILEKWPKFREYYIKSKGEKNEI